MNLKELISQEVRRNNEMSKDPYMHRFVQPISPYDDLSHGIKMEIRTALGPVDHSRATGALYAGEEIPSDLLPKIRVVVNDAVKRIGKKNW